MNELIITTTLGAGRGGAQDSSSCPRLVLPLTRFPGARGLDLAPGDQRQMAGQVIHVGGDAGDIWLLRDQLCVLWSRGRTYVCPFLPSMQSCVQDRPPPGSKSSSVQGYLLIPGLCWSELWKMSPQLRAGGHAVAIVC